MASNQQNRRWSKKVSRPSTGWKYCYCFSIFRSGRKLTGPKPSEDVSFVKPIVELCEMAFTLPSQREIQVEFDDSALTTGRENPIHIEKIARLLFRSLHHQVPGYPQSP